MEINQIERLDHHAVVMGMIKDLGIIDLINGKLQKNDSLEKVSPGEAIAGMLLNGLGFVGKPLYLAPKFFKTIPLQHLFGKNIEAEDFNYDKLARTLDAIYDYGCESLFYLISMHCCLKEKIDLQVNSNDTTSFSVTGNVYPNIDKDAVEVKLGHSKDHRPDLKQVVHEMMVSQDGGVPLMMKTHSGNASDSTIFKERSEELIVAFNETEGQRHAVMDSKLYSKTNSENLLKLGFITRIPATIKEEKNSIKEAFSKDQWKIYDKKNKYYCRKLKHYEIQQRWFVIYSMSAESRAKKSVAKKIKGEVTHLDKKLKQLDKKTFCCEADAEAHLKSLQKNWKWHELKSHEIIEQDKVYKITYTYELNKEKEHEEIQQKSCYIVGSNLTKEQRTDKDIIADYKGQNTSVEKGFAFLKDKLFFVGAIFLKTPRRIMALLMIMTLSLLVYSLAQRRARNFLLTYQETVPSQLNKLTNKPTLRWLFQLLEGIHLVCYNVGHEVRYLYDGIDDLRAKILGCFGETVKKYYGLI